jgi:hypothetical protein
MKSWIGTACLTWCSMVHSQQPQPSQLTPEQKQQSQEQADTIVRATDAITNLANLANGIVKKMVRQCVATGVVESRCECLANNIPIGIGADKEMWGDASRTPWLAYVSLVSIDAPEAEILSQLKTPNARKIIQATFKARYTCN